MSPSHTPPERRRVDDAEAQERQVSEGGSGSLSAETTLGGADAVPDTPDGVAENYTPEADEADEAAE